MLGRTFVMVSLFVMPAAADVGLFQKIRRGDQIRLVVPNGECDAKVVSRKVDQLGVKLKTTTSACGARESLIVVSRADVRDVLNKRHWSRNKLLSAACILPFFALGPPAAYGVGEKTGNGGAALAVLFGSAAAGAVVCRPRGTTYVLFADHFAPAQP